MRACAPEEPAGDAGLHSNEVLVRLHRALAVSEASRAEAEADNAQLRAALAAATEQLESLLRSGTLVKDPSVLAECHFAASSGSDAGRHHSTAVLVSRSPPSLVSVLPDTQLSCVSFKAEETLKTARTRAAADSCEVALLEVAAARAASAAALEGDLQRRAAACALRARPVLGGARQPHRSRDASLLRD